MRSALLLAVVDWLPRACFIIVVVDSRSTWNPASTPASKDCSTGTPACCRVPHVATLADSCLPFYERYHAIHGSGFSRIASRYRTHRRLRTDTGSTIRSERKRRLLAIHFTGTADHREYPCSASNCGLTALYSAEPASTSERKRRVFAIHFTDTANHRESPCSANNCGLTALYSADPASTRQSPACRWSAAEKYDQGKAKAGPSFRLRHRHFCLRWLTHVYRFGPSWGEIGEIWWN
jgi:hypothetical protein